MFRYLIIAGAACLAAGTAHGVTLTFAGNPNLVTGERGVALEQDGINVAAQGFVAEARSGAADARVFGPFPVADTRQATRSGALLNLDGSLGLYAMDTPEFDLSGRDNAFANATPGLNGYYMDNPEAVEKTDFIVFSFDQTVDIEAADVDDVSNFDRDAWFAYGITAPDFSAGLLGGLTDYTFLNSNDDATDGPFTHALNATGLRYLVVGSPFREGDGLGPIATGRSQFYVTGFTNVTANDGGTVTPTPPPPPAPIPLPASAALLLGALGLLGSARRSAGRTSDHRS